MIGGDTVLIFEKGRQVTIYRKLRNLERRIATYKGTKKYYPNDSNHNQTQADHFIIGGEAIGVKSAKG